MSSTTEMELRESVMSRTLLSQSKLVVLGFCMEESEDPELSYNIKRLASDASDVSAGVVSLRARIFGIGKIP